MMTINNGEKLFNYSTPLNTNQQWQVIQDRVELESTDDYYSFKLSNRSSFNLVLNDLSDNTDVRLLKDGVQIASSSGKGIQDESISRILNPGTYHIQVELVGDAGTDYSLNFKSNYLPEGFEFNVEVNNGGIKLTDTKIFDPDCVDDLQKVDFWLKQQGESWKKLSSVSEFYSNTDGSISFNYEISNLEQGKYNIWGKATDKLGALSNGWGESFQVENLDYSKIENVAPSNLGFTMEEVSGGIKLNNTKVFDANGIDDLQKIDFSLKKEGGEWIDIEDALNFITNQDNSIGFNYSIAGLEKGNYQLKATAYDKNGASGDTLISDFQVQNIAPSDFKFDIEVIQGGVRVIDTKVFDANGIDDLSGIDFWLKKQGENWQNITDASEFRKNQDGSFSFDYSIDSLASGDYILWARSQDRANSNSSSWRKSFQIVEKIPSQPQQDWFDRNLEDQSIRTLTRSLFSDHNLSRNDMIAILRDAKDNNVVDEVEIKDLRQIVENASYLGMADYVRVLSNKVVNGDVANKSGNLQPGSSDVQLESLINKWFKGVDRPTTIHTYQYAQGSLFQNGISHDDINQGYINNCFFLAGLGATLIQSPETIQNMFIDNGDRTFTVRFYNQGVADYVTVDRYLPTNNIGNFVYANPGDYHGNVNNELWVALAEKAYAQLNESGWIYQDGTNSYDGIGNAGYLSDAFAHITGKKSRLGRQLNIDKVVNAFESGEVVGFGSKSSGIASNIVNSHAYALVDYNTSTGKFTLLNPWSTDNTAIKSRTLELSWNEISNNFSYWDSTISNVVST